MTLDQFKLDKTMMKGAAELRGNLYYQSMMAVLETEFRRSMAVNPLHLAQDDKSYRLGEITGFNTCLQMLRTMADPPAPPPKQIESKWENLVEK